MDPTMIDLALKGFAIIGVLYTGYMIGGHGLKWVITKLGTWVSTGKSDVSSLEARFTSFEQEVRSFMQTPSNVVVVNPPTVGVTGGVTGPSGLIIKP